MNKKQILASLMLVAMCFIIACSNENTESSDDRGGSINVSNGSVDSSIIEEYRYISSNSDLAHLASFVHRAVYHDGFIYFCYVDETTEASVNNSEEEHIMSKIVIESISSNGTQEILTEIIVPFTGVSIAALHITENGTFALVIASVDWVDLRFDPIILYLEYSPEGVEIERRELDGIALQSGESFIMGEAVVAGDDGIVFLTREADKQVIYVYDSELSLLNRMELVSGQYLCRLRDGRVMVNDRDVVPGLTRTVLREVDFTTGGWGVTHAIPVADIHGLHTAQADDPFDLYIDDGTNLFGYEINTGNKIMILDWSDTWIEVGPGFSPHINFMDDGRISMLINRFGNAPALWQTEHVILTRTARAHRSDVEIITVGGLYIRSDPELMAHVFRFNALNENYQIEVREYGDKSKLEDHHMHELRFLTDVITGNAPDIIVGNMAELVIMSERGFLLDLYPFLDADPDLSRSDFFPGILSAMETSDGSLPLIGSGFYIRTMIGMPDIVGDIDSWTFANMLALIEQADDSDMPLILSELMTSERFLGIALQYSGSDIIDWSSNTANLDSGEFMQILEISSRFPNVMTPWAEDMPSPVMRLLRREQLLDIIDLYDPASYQMYTVMLGDDIVALGMPTQDGGANAVSVYGYAISANSKNNDAAWDFIRYFLMPELTLSTSIFPLRIDLFDAMIENAKIPHLVIDENGNEVEHPKGYNSIFIGLQDFRAPIYAMTDAEEMGLRSIVENKSIINYLDETIMEMIQEETRPFFAGARSAADTARVLQNRIQTFLSERD